MKDDALEQSVTDLIVDVCEVLYNHGYRTASIGAIMRLIGVNNESAAQHDNELFKLDEDFEDLVKSKKPQPPIEIKIPPGAMIH